MKKNCRLEGCPKQIPPERHANARYCSDACQYIARKNRSSAMYWLMKKPYDKIKKNEKILAMLYERQQRGITITFSELVYAELDLGFSTGDGQDEHENLVKQVGDYAYSINPTNKIVTIWKN